MDMAGGGAMMGSMANDLINIVGNGVLMHQLGIDNSDMNKAFEQLMRYADLNPQKLKIAAQQAGLQPDVVMSSVRNAQKDALRQLQNLGAKGGLDQGAMAAMQQAQARSSRALQGDQQAIQQNIQARGLQAGSGAELAMRQNAAQSAANSLAMAGTQSVADARQRALQAIVQSGRLSGDISSAQQAIAENNRQARTERDRFNTSIRQATNQFNSQAEKDAWQANLNKRTAVMNASTAKAGQKRANRQQNKGYIEDTGNRTQNLMSNFGKMGSM